MAELVDPDLAALPAASYLWGRVRRVVNAFAVAWARELVPDPYWFEVAEETGTTNPDPAAVAAIARDRLFVVRDPEQLAPAPPLSSAMFASVVRAEDRTRTAELLAEFVRLPERTREVASAPRPEGLPAVVLFANVDRMRRYYPGYIAENAAIIESIAEAGVSVVFTLTGAPAPDRLAGPFATVIEVRADSVSNWRHGEVVAERATPRSRLRVGVPRSLGSIPALGPLLDSDTVRGP